LEIKKRKEPSMKKVLLFSLVVQLLVTVAFAKDAKDVAGKIFKNHQEATIRVSLVIKAQIAMEGRDSRSSDDKTETLGTVLSPDGLVVVSLSSVDPSHIYQQYLEDTDSVKIDIQLTNARYILPDNQEVEAKVLLRDKDLDLVFLRPLKPLEKPLKYIPSDQSDKAEILDEVIWVGRLGQEFRREACVKLGYISAVMNKPRTFYLPEGADSLEILGCPVFAVSGKVIGIQLIRFQKSSSSSLSSMLSGKEGLQSVILPIADIMEVAAQVPQVSEKDIQEEQKNSQEESEDPEETTEDAEEESAETE